MSNWEEEYEYWNEREKCEDNEYRWECLRESKCRFYDRTRRNETKNIDIVLKGYRSKFHEVTEFYIQPSKDADIHSEMRVWCIKNIDREEQDYPDLCVAVCNKQDKVLCLALRY